MANWLIGAVTLVYAAVALCRAYEGKWGMSLVFFAYAIANIGLVLADLWREGR